MELSNEIRFYHFLSGVLSRQKADPFCGRCKAFANSVTAVREALEEFARAHSGEISGLSEELRTALSEATRSLAELNPPVDAVGQKKAGNCTLPQGICFVKSSKALLEKIV